MDYVSLNQEIIALFYIPESWLSCRQLHDFHGVSSSFARINGGCMLCCHALVKRDETAYRLILQVLAAAAILVRYIK